jgi:uncharacterized protein YabE (DUF348 family)
METIKKVGSKIVKSKLKVILIISIVVFCAATIFAAAANSYSIEINVDGNTRKITTFKSDAYAILEQANIAIKDGDIVDLSEFESNTDSKITVYQRCNITVYDNNVATQYSAVATVEKALADNGITLSDDDTINCAKTDYIYDGMEIYITRAIPVTITADGETININVAGSTVSDALDKAVITADDDDEISEPLDAALTPNMQITVTRVSYSERTETEAVNYSTTTTESAALYTDQSKVTQEGVDGERRVVYSDKYVNGELAESTEINSAVTKEAVNEIKVVGTKIHGQRFANSVKTISNLTAPSDVELVNNIPTNYKKKIVGTASAYSGGGTTATGRAAQNGYIAVNPNVIPYGTKMWIVSNDGRYVYGYASAEDTGGFVNWSGSRTTLCDLYMSSESQASAFGRRSVTIYIL